MNFKLEACNIQKNAAAMSNPIKMRIAHDMRILPNSAWLQYWCAILLEYGSFEKWLITVGFLKILTIMNAQYNSMWHSGIYPGLANANAAKMQNWRQNIVFQLNTTLKRIRICKNSAVLLDS